MLKLKTLKIKIKIESNGPNIQERGILKESATIALGKEITKKIKKFSENRSLKFSLFKGSASIFFISL